MDNNFILLVIAFYFALLMLIAYFTGKKNSGNETFFRANKQAPWYVVAIAMVGTSISGVTFISVPGWVRQTDMTYLQMALGFFAGYCVIAYVLLPLYYRLNLTTIYGFLDQRYGKHAYKTGAWFFLLSKIVGAAARLYLVAFILQKLVFESLGIPFSLTVAGIIGIIWLYSNKSGIKTIIWTDSLQTILFVTALILILVRIAQGLDFDLFGMVSAITESSHARIFVFDDWTSRQHFVKQFFSGMFITIVMTGLDQDMMQKNLSIRNLKDARKNVISYGFAFLPINLLFLSLGVLLLIFASSKGISLPEISDNILPYIVSEELGGVTLAIFIIGVVAAAFSSADSALTALTTSFCVDILGMESKDKEEQAQQNIKTRKRVHIGMSVVFMTVILLIEAIGSDSIIDAIYRLASYTYGPLLGLYACGLYTRLKPTDRYIPYIAVAAPLLCFALENILLQMNYKMGYELLLINGAITAFGLWLLSLSSKSKSQATI